jgi:hypothetical protein
MRVTSDVANGFERMETFSDAGAVEKAVTSWLAEVVTI